MTMSSKRNGPSVTKHFSIGEYAFGTQVTNPVISLCMLYLFGFVTSISYHSFFVNGLALKAGSRTYNSSSFSLIIGAIWYFQPTSPLFQYALGVWATKVPKAKCLHGSENSLPLFPAFNISTIDFEKRWARSAHPMKIVMSFYIELVLDV